MNRLSEKSVITAEQLQVGDIILMKPEITDVVGQTIAAITESDYCHIAMVTSNQVDDLRIVELINDGVYFHPLHIYEDETEDYSGFVMRLKTPFNAQSLLDTAQAMQLKVAFDITGLFILRDFQRVYSSLHCDPDVSNCSELFLLAASEIIYMLGRIDYVEQIESASKMRHMFGESEEAHKVKMHCAQFIYNLFHSSGEGCQLDLNGGFFLNDFDVDNIPVRKDIAAQSALTDKVDALTAILKQEIEKEHTELKEIISKTKIQRKTPIMNGKQYRMAEERYIQLLESEYPTAATLVTVNDFLENADNLQQIGSIKAAIDRGAMVR